MRFIITGAGGFIGQELALALIKAHPSAELVLTDVVEPPIPTHSSQSSHPQITSTKADLTTTSAVESLFRDPFTACYLLHGIMSGQSESDFELGMRVNLDSVRGVLDHLRRNHPGTPVIFTSSTAVFGNLTPGQVITEATFPAPQSSYGCEKFIVETLLNEYSRRGFLDARIVRLPTVVVRPGKPTGAASSFASGIVRESLKGEKNLLPVGQDTGIWICSPKTVIKNLLLAKDVDKTKFKGSRVVNLPGKSVYVRDILKALEVVAGPETRALVEEKVDKETEKIVLSWPVHFDTTYASDLGFDDDVALEETIKTYADSLKA